MGSGAHRITSLRRGYRERAARQLRCVKKQAAKALFRAYAPRVQVLHTISINVSPDMRRTLINPTLNSKFEDVANGRSNTLAAGLTQLLHDWEFLFGCACPLLYTDSTRARRL